MFFVRIPYCYGIVKMRSYHCFIQWQERVFVKKLEVLRIIFFIFVALLTAWLMWSSKNSFVSIITPTSFCFSIVSSEHMCVIEYLISPMLLFPIVMCVHLLG